MADEEHRDKSTGSADQSDSSTANGASGSEPLASQDDPVQQILGLLNWQKDRQAELDQKISSVLQEQKLQKRDLDAKHDEAVKKILDDQARLQTQLDTKMKKLIVETENRLDVTLERETRG